jgi:SOS-response transcriptional repressor LexA
MTNNRAASRDEVLFAFHEACERPSPELILEWATQYPQFADDIREHAEHLLAWAAHEDRSGAPDDDAQVTRSWSRALNAMYNAEREEAAAHAVSPSQPVERRFGSRRLPRLTWSHESASTRDIPLVGCAPCGSPLLAEQNLLGLVPVPQSAMQAGRTYFLLEAKGDSMTEAGIEDGCLVLVHQQDIAESKDIVVALAEDEATIKELQRTHDRMLLIPHSRNPSHQAIELRDDFRVQGVAIATLERGVGDSAD